jgi:hypothetical protein
VVVRVSIKVCEVVTVGTSVTELVSMTVGPVAVVSVVLVDFEMVLVTATVDFGADA